MSVHTTAGAILAGGRARRFDGRDKSRLVVDGTSIIVRQIQLLQRVTGDVFLVGHAPERFADLGLRTVEDRVAGAGALGGIYSALASTTADRVLVVACDMPFLVEPLLQSLLVLAASGDGAWVRTRRGPEPLVACYRQSARERIREAIEAGHLKAADLGLQLRMGELSEQDMAAFGDPDRVLANLNTPEDYARIQ